MSSRFILRNEIIGIDFSIPSETITEIEFYNVQFISYPTFPQHITSLIFEQCQFQCEDPIQFHEGLHSLRQFQQAMLVGTGYYSVQMPNHVNGDGEAVHSLHRFLNRTGLGLQPPFRMHLPASLHSLFIRKMRFPTFPTLPESLQVLRLLRVASPVLQSFPSSLLKLCIIECYWRILPPFPSQLQVLLLDEIELDTLPPIPPSVIHYQECEVCVRDRHASS
jgi:hypothetical protein